ncbi:MAG TPA: M48 family metalloprotease [Xanthobacteraceae bacterium]|nr:M48 family metalloprotease [Xanthobacteraceae bacterium]
MAVAPAPPEVPAMRLGRRLQAALLVGLALMFAGCAGETLAPMQTTAAAAVKPEQMPRATEREHLRILAAYGGAYEDPRLEAHLAHTVDRLVAASEQPNIKYRVTILNSPAVNAFALSSGQLYVTRGLLALANDTSEVASVLAHEIAHVIARHAAFRENQMRQAQIFSRVAADLLGDPQLGALALARSKIALASFSRAQELEADGIGVGISARAGFDPYGAQRFLTSMGRNAQLRSQAAGIDQRPPDFLSSHPSTPERIKNARANARQYVGPSIGKSDRAEYLALIDGLVYGEDPSEGFVRGRRFVHPKLGFTYTAPEGFALDNTQQAVFGIKAGGAQALRLDVVRASPDVSLADYLNSGWVEGIDGRTVQELALNGLPAATAIARNDTWIFRLYAVLLDGDVFRFIFAAKHDIETADRAFRESMATFRRISPAEGVVKPHRLKIVRVAPGQTIENLARRMAVPDRRVELFRALNGLSPADTLKPGDPVKLVIE